MTEPSRAPGPHRPAERSDAPPGHRVVATAGHVDHGKSTLLRALTGMEPDRLAEERRRGLTLDLGYAWTGLPPASVDATPRTVAFVDVPGHERFVATMLAGAGAAPAALPVVAADDGWSPQSAEHRDVLDLLQVPAVALVVTKADLVDDARVDEVRTQIDAERAGTSLADAPIVVTDALSGRGIEELLQTLADRLAVLPPPADVGRPRLWIDRSFSVPGAGTVVTGTLTEGRLSTGEQVTLLPSAVRARIRGLQALGATVDSAAAGTRVAVNLGGIDHLDVDRGDVLVGGGPWELSSAADVWLRVLPGHRVEHSGAWHLHVGSASSVVRVLPISGPLEGPRGHTRGGGRHAGTAAGEGTVRLRLAEPLPLVAGDRVVLRETGRRAVVAGGVVADPAPARRPRGPEEREIRSSVVADIAAADRSGRLRALVSAAGGHGPSRLLLAAAGWPEDEPLPDGLLRLSEHIVDRGTLAVWAEAVRGLGPGTHDRAAIADAIRPLGGNELLAAPLADHLVAEQVLVRTSGGYALPEHVDAASAARRARASAVIAKLLEEPFAPPDLDELARQAGMDHRELSALVQSGEVVRCGKVAFARKAVEQAAEVLGELGADGRAFTAAEAKQAWGTTRRYAIPLLEHLDRIGVTTFDGQHRWLR